MKISLRKTLNGCKLIDFEEGNGHIGIYLEDKNGTVYAVNIHGEYENTNLIEAAPEGSVQEQPSDKITTKLGNASIGISSEEIAIEVR